MHSKQHGIEEKCKGLVVAKNSNFIRRVFIGTTFYAFFILF